MNATPDNVATINAALTALGLQRHPYLDAPDAQFFYADPGLIQRLDLLQHLTQFGDMLLCINGPLGSGKTTLAEQFMLRGNTHWRCCHLNAAQLQQPSELVARVAEGFGLHAAGPAERLKIDLVRQFQNIRHNSQLPVLVIDDAHLLPDNVLKTLLELTEQPRETLKLLRIALFGEAGLTQRLTAMGWHSPQQPLLHSMDIPSFNEEQTAAYLMYRLAVAGYSGECPFSLTEIRALHKAAAGLPGKLNTLAQETLLEHAGLLAARKVVTPPNRLRRRQKFLALGLAGSALIAGLVWQISQDRGKQTDTPQEAQDTAMLSAPPAIETSTAPVIKPEAPLSQAPTKFLDKTPKISQPIEDIAKNKAAQIQAPPESAPSAEPGSSPVIGAEKPAAPTPQAPAGDSPATVATTIAPPSLPVTVSPPTETLPATSVMPTPAPPTEAAIVSTETVQTAPAPPALAAVKPAQITPPAPEHVTAQTSTPVVAPKAEPVVITPAAAAKLPTTAATATTASRPELLGADWLQNRPGSHYTLQLLGGRREKSLRDYLRQNDIPEPVAIFRTEFKGADWYVLVHGDYPSFVAARSAIATLPSNVRNGKPWARSFATVHADINKARP